MFTTVNKVILYYSIINHDDGTFNLINQDGTVISIQPDGSMGFRPEGANGSYEKFVGTSTMAAVKPASDIYTFGILDISGL